MNEMMGFERMGFEMLGLEMLGLEMLGFERIGLEMIATYATPKKNKLKNTISRLLWGFAS